MSQRAMRYAEAAFAPLDRELPPPPAPRAKPVQHEQLFQGAVVELLRLYERQRKLAWWVIPNGAMLQGDHRQRAIRAKILIDRGMMRPGAVDVGLCLAPTGRTGVIELKHGGNKPTPGQVDFMAEVARMGGYAETCWNLDQFKQTVDEWLKAEHRGEGGR